MKTTSTKITLGVTAALVAAAGLGWGVYRAEEKPPAATTTEPARRNATALPPASPSGSAFANTATDAKSLKTSAAAPKLADALSLTDAFKRKLALASLGHDTSAADTKRALELLAQLKIPADRSAFIEGLMAAVAKMSPADAIAFAVDLAADGWISTGQVKTGPFVWSLELGWFCGLWRVSASRQESWPVRALTRLGSMSLSAFTAN